MSRTELRDTFDRVAELYDRARPGYPQELFDDLAELAVLAPGARVLEIGCGTGQATVPMAERGYRIVAVEIGKNLAAIATRNLASFPNVEAHTAAFEEWTCPPESFDLVMTATAFGWIDPEVRYTKSASALKPGGALAVFGSKHVAGGDDEFFEAVQECYERFMPGTPSGLKLPSSEEVQDDRTEIDAVGLFDPPVFRRYVWQTTYATGQYLDLLNTYSGHLLLAANRRRELLRCVADLLESRFGGRIRKQYLTQLLVARKTRR